MSKALKKIVRLMPAGVTCDRCEESTTATLSEVAAKEVRFCFHHEEWRASGLVRECQFFKPKKRKSQAAHE
jgi:hypothetical protein